MLDIVSEVERLKTVKQEKLDLLNKLKSSAVKLEIEIHSINGAIALGEKMIMAQNDDDRTPE
jgi:hypothetical protein